MELKRYLSPSLFLWREGGKRERGREGGRKGGGRKGEFWNVVVADPRMRSFVAVLLLGEIEINAVRKGIRLVIFS